MQEHRNLMIAAYVRVSTITQAKENFSLEDQEACINNWARENNATIVKTFRDRGKSAYRGSRPAFEAMLQEIATGSLRVDCVVVYNQARFSRNENSRRVAMEILQKAGVRFKSILEPTPDDSDLECLVQGLTGTMAEFQSRGQSKMSALKLNNAAERGFHTGGALPYGFKSVYMKDLSQNKKRKILAIDEQEAEIVRLIYKLASEGTGGIRFGVKKITSYLNENLISKRERMWAVNDVHRILKDTIYYGERHFGKNRKRSDICSGIIKQTVPAIVEKELFDNVQLYLSHYAPVKNNHQAVTSESLLTGLIKCGCCGSNMVINTGKSGRYKYYKCRMRIKCSTNICTMRQIPKDTIEKVVISEIRQSIITEDFLLKIFNEIKLSIKNKYALLDRQLFELNSKKAHIEKRYARLISLIADGELSPNEFITAQIEECEKERNIFANKIREIKETIRLPIRRFGQKQTKQFIRAVQQVLLNNDTPSCKCILNALVSTITVRSDAISVRGSKFLMMVAASQYDGGHSEYRVPAHISIWRRSRDLNPA
ncbi:recombinase family protein [Shewanella algae]|uniref:recombinase family protein n=1 Tax=Shewanella algae TaxID=38313 RepID=UPI000E32FA6C|nr:recombinase family protein [Shewanella algae]AXQ15851.1 hypothetical protein BS332_17910 [Shewanella algae]QXP18778.1 recombinase family protein [Shewanella algae]QXP28339.1 recombinase family protein [Shewanella algae]QXP34651.1 recombinase family protein [Shewanella algae]QXP37533.1 recombinase family protein [Shewanella algae]